MARFKVVAVTYNLWDRPLIRAEFPWATVLLSLTLFTALYIGLPYLNAEDTKAGGFLFSFGTVVLLGVVMCAIAGYAETERKLSGAETILSLVDSKLEKSVETIIQDTVEAELRRLCEKVKYIEKVDPKMARNIRDTEFTPLFNAAKRLGIIPSDRGFGDYFQPETPTPTVNKDDGSDDIVDASYEMPR